MKYNKLSTFSWCFGFIIGFVFFYYNNPLQKSIDSLTNNEFIEFSFINIFENNLKVLFINVIGSLTFGLLTYINLVFNGFMFFHLIKLIYIVNPKYYLNLLPHSIEIIGFIIAGAIGIELGKILFNYTFIGNVKKEINIGLLALKFSFATLITLIAAILEVYVSPNL